jgi:hypothetical protein
LIDGRTGIEKWGRSGEGFAAGDANGDGRAETLVESSTFANGVTSYSVNSALVDSAGATVLAATRTVTSPTPANFQTQVDAAEDVNGDGAPDVAEQVLKDGSPVGSRVVSGRTLTAIGPDPNPAVVGASLLQASMDSAGADSVVWTSSPESLAGYDLASGAQLWTHSLAGRPYDNRPPVAVAADVTGDGRADVVTWQYRSGVIAGQYGSAEVVEVIDGATGARRWQQVALYG